jgi:hypothetical protein
MKSTYESSSEIKQEYESSMALINIKVECSGMGKQATSERSLAEDYNT